MILENGVVRTLELSLPTTGALAIAGDRVVGGVGTHETALATPDVEQPVGRREIEERPLPSLEARLRNGVDHPANLRQPRRSSPETSSRDRLGICPEIAPRPRVKRCR